MSEKRRVPVLVPVLALIFVTFIGILIYTWVEAKKANPKMLDEHGRVKDTAALMYPPTGRA